MDSNLYFHLIIPYILLVLVANVVTQLWWKPKRIENHFLRQGINGPNYELFLGNLKELATFHLKASSQNLPLFHHDILPRVLSFYHRWKQIYGPNFLVWFGITARLVVSDPILIKDILVLKPQHFEKVEQPARLKRIEGDGLLNLKGEKWAHHRKIIHPIFYTDNLKLMIPMMTKTVEEALVKWSEKLSKYRKIEIEASCWFRDLAQDLITRATFGNSYYAGRAIFQLQTNQIAHTTQDYPKLCIPGYRFLPTKSNILSWILEKQIRKSFLNLINNRRARMRESSSGEPNDLLEIMIKAADESPQLKQTACASAVKDSDIVEECKTFFFAGMETVSSLLTWTAVLLAMHPQWQEHAREEVWRVCGGARDMSTPTKDDLAKLKLLGMILNESLRLYPPVVATIRQVKNDVELGGIHIKRGTELLIPILASHHDPGLWRHGEHEFNPMRFEKGAAQAATEHQVAFMPFGLGERRCVGQSLAILQAKLVMAIILSRFSFELAPNYVHAPSVTMLLHPQHGAPLVFRKL